MDRKRRQHALLAVLVVGLGGAAYLQWPRRAPDLQPPASPAARNAAGGTANDPATGPDVHLEALEADRPNPAESERNLFRFKPKAAPMIERPSAAIREQPGPPPGPPPPPPVPPIPLRFIGVLEPGGSAKIAILSDGRGAPLYGKEGETVLGQYKILRIGVESIELSHLDGQGRQTIRLSGS